MNGASSTAVVESARDAARARIEEDRRRVPAEVAGLLEEIGERLYEPGFDATELVRGACGPEVGWRFRQHLGFGVQAYVDRRRMETARELLERTELAVAEVAKSVGFEDPELFAKWFKRRAGRAPARLRSSGSPRRPLRRMAGWELRQAVLGRLGRHDYVALMRSLRAQYPEAFLAPEEAS